MLAYLMFRNGTSFATALNTVFDVMCGDFDLTPHAHVIQEQSQIEGLAPDITVHGRDGGTFMQFMLPFPHRTDREMCIGINLSSSNVYLSHGNGFDAIGRATLNGTVPDHVNINNPAAIYVNSGDYVIMFRFNEAGLYMCFAQEGYIWNSAFVGLDVSECPHKGSEASLDMVVVSNLRLNASPRVTSYTYPSTTLPTTFASNYVTSSCIVRGSEYSTINSIPDTYVDADGVVVAGAMCEIALNRPGNIYTLRLGLYAAKGATFGGALGIHQVNGKNCLLVYLSHANKTDVLVVED